MPLSLTAFLSILTKLTAVLPARQSGNSARPHTNYITELQATAVTLISLFSPKDIFNTKPTDMKFDLYLETAEHAPTYEEQLLLNFDEFLKKGCTNIRKAVSAHASGYRMLKGDLKGYFQPERFKIRWDEEQTEEYPAEPQENEEEQETFEMKIQQ
ncbi:hypothetical protein [Flavobacterium chungbukense]|uniref:Uncharacterized protein n=1 Tax=Flavobacterium chungbukense TaxID=877464 RepID=A0ABP7YES0_9FLAO|nr:hypothetical protein [Flavobacterium chungbukense]MCC4920530.1 hypothetical protein [Flavobacterium chungbukense]